MRFLSGMTPRTTRLTVAGLVGGIAVTASTLLSGSGIYFSLSGSAMSEPARLAVSSVSTLFLTLLAFRFWMQVGRASRERQLRKGHSALPQPRLWIHVAGGAVMSLLSVLTGTTALIYLGNRDGVQALINQTAFAATIEQVARLAADMAVIASEASMADRIAAQRSQREAAEGGTCGSSPKGTGPLTRMRAAHAGAASDIATRAEKLSRAATEINRALITARDQNTVNALFLDAVALGAHADRIAITMEADALARGYGGQGFLFEDRQRSCRDEELAQLFARIAASASGVAELPTQPPLRREVQIFDAFAVTIPILLNADHGRAVGINRATILPFVLFTLLVDLVSLAGAVGHGSSLARRLSDKESAQLHRTAWVLRNFLWEFPVTADDVPVERAGREPCQAFIFVPKGGNPERTRQAEYLTALFDLSVAPAFQFEPLIARRKEFEPWVEQMRLASGGATHYAIYPIKDQKTYERIMEMKRDALRALALTPIDGSELPEFQLKSPGQVRSLRSV